MKVRLYQTRSSWSTGVLKCSVLLQGLLFPSCAPICLINRRGASLLRQAVRVACRVLHTEVTCLSREHLCQRRGTQNRSADGEQLSLGVRLTGNSRIFQDVHSGELQQLRDRLAESDRSLHILRQREARAHERCANVQQERDDVQAKIDEIQVRIREQPR